MTKEFLSRFGNIFNIPIMKALKNKNEYLKIKILLI